MKRKKKIIYIAHQISGDVEGNLAALREIYRKLTRQNKVIPVIPYYAALMSLDDNKPADRKAGIAHNKALIQSGVFDELWLYGPRVSKGIIDEIQEFTALNLPIVSKSRGTKKYDKLKALNLA